MIINKLVLSTFILFLFTITSCQEEEVVSDVMNNGGRKAEPFITDQNLALDDLSLDFSQGKFDLDGNLEDLALEMADLIYHSEGMEDKHATFSGKISILNQGDYLQIYINTEGKNNGARVEAGFAAPCKPQKKTCHSEQCVKDTLAAILGDGTRDVNISYKRKTFSVEITWTYMDC